MNIKKPILIIFLIPLTSYNAISIVYNLRIAETTRRQVTDPLLKKPAKAIITPFIQFRKKDDGSHHDIEGGLATFNYTFHSFYVKVDSAVARAHQEKEKFHFSRVQTDDVLVTTGYTSSFNKKIKFTASALFGFPTHSDTSLEHIQFGYGHYSIGAQIDGSYSYCSNENFTLRPAARFIHFFARDALIKDSDNIQFFDFNIGNLADLYIAHNFKYGNHRFEIGYDASFFFDATIQPFFEHAVDKSNYIRSSFYGNYKYYFTIKKFMNVITVAFSYGFDHTPKIFGNKYIITFWGSWGINF
jgi:hypothetical protein